MSISCTQREQLGSVHASCSVEKSRDLADGFGSLSAVPDDFHGRDVTLDKKKKAGGNKRRRAADIFTEPFLRENAPKTPHGTLQTPLNVFIVVLEWRRGVVAFKSGVNWRLQRRYVLTAVSNAAHVPRRGVPGSTSPASPSQVKRARQRVDAGWNRKKNPTQTKTHTSPGLASVICLGRPASAASLL